MKEYTIIAGVNGTGKTSFRGVLEGQGIPLGHIIDPDLIAATHQYMRKNTNTLIDGRIIKTVNVYWLCSSKP